jgi:L-fuculose-phosphate aldolase
MDLKKTVVHYAKLLYERGYVVATFGNLSVKRKDGFFIVTPSGKRKYEILESDLVVVDKNGKVIEGDLEPTVDLKMHLFIYEVRSDVGAIIHAHPPYITAFSFQMPREYEPQLPELREKMGGFAFVSYKPPGSDELAEAVKEKATQSKIIILQKHGMISLGKNLEEAFNLVEEAEFDIKVRMLKGG